MELKLKKRKRERSEAKARRKELKQDDHDGEDQGDVFDGHKRQKERIPGMGSRRIVNH